MLTVSESEIIEALQILSELRTKSGPEFSRICTPVTAGREQGKAFGPDADYAAEQHSLVTIVITAPAYLSGFSSPQNAFRISHRCDRG